MDAVKWVLEDQVQIRRRVGKRSATPARVSCINLSLRQTSVCNEVSTFLERTSIDVPCESATKRCVCASAAAKAVRSACALLAVKLRSVSLSIWTI